MAEETIKQETQSVPIPEDNEPNVVIITGMSGAGRTEAVHTFEDLGYFCIDNLPPELIMSIVSLANIPGQNEGSRKLAIACPIRTQYYYDQLVKELANLDAAGLSYRIVFLDSKDDALIARYKASRRLHPLSMDNHLSIAQAIARERELNKDLKKMADFYIDTSEISTKILRDRLRELYSSETKREGMSVVVYSFGFKHGAPVDADIVIDVRFLPNPFYIPEMRPLTGLDEPVHDFVMYNSETESFLAAWKNLLDVVMPGYVAEGKRHVAIGVGCTGGQHRSVVLAEQTANYLKDEGYNVTAYHRDIALADTEKVATK
ncbi:RNase adapter RapZ [Anaerotardibacter muris]|uniref:RNase adapter RapZ n=1 Tax=Anaerotardibacter muris TaxID=2941505 RepID=UPI00203BCC10|nr:RNase adapter RapZ [Anaerotardibacter muris]